MKRQRLTDSTFSAGLEIAVRMFLSGAAMNALRSVNLSPR
jgi:hypothetical protein